MQKLMLAILSFLLILLSAGIMMGQTPMLDYYKKVNLAELAICDSNFALANQYYADAFRINSKKAFYRDLTNAFHSAIDSREDNLAEKYLLQLMRHGMDSLTEANIISGYTGKPFQKVYDLFARCRSSNTIARIKNDPLVKKLKQLYEGDQGVRAYYIDVMHMDDYMTDSVYYTDAVNAKQLLKIFKETGIPGDAIANETGYDIIIWHNTGAGFGGMASHIFDTTLYKGVLSFDYDARKFAEVVSASALSSSFEYGNMTLRFPLMIMGAKYDRKMYLECYDDTSEARINKERAKIGLETLSDIRKKLEARNKGLAFNSVWHKYGLTSPMTVVLYDDEAKFKEWQQTKGKDTGIRNAYNFKALDQILQIGSIDGFIIGQTKNNYEDSIFNNRVWLKSYNQGAIYFSSWVNGHAPLRWNCHATIVENPNENLATDAGRYNRALSVPGYQYIVTQAWEAPFKLNNIVMLFGPDSTLISFTANGAVFYNKVVTHYCGPATSFKTTNRIVPLPTNTRYNVILTTKTYTWVKNNLKTEITIAEELNEKGVKRTVTTYQMTDTVQYAAYMNKVTAEKRRLDAQYAQRANMGHR